MRGRPKSPHLPILFATVAMLLRFGFRRKEIAIRLGLDLVRVRHLVRLARLAGQHIPRKRDDQYVSEEMAAKVSRLSATLSPQQIAAAIGMPLSSVYHLRAVARRRGLPVASLPRTRVAVTKYPRRAAAKAPRPLGRPPTSPEPTAWVKLEAAMAVVCGRCFLRGVHVCTSNQRAA